MNDFNKTWKQYIISEGVSTPDVGVWLQSLRENLNMLRPRSVKEGKRIELMKHQLNEIRRSTSRLQREMKFLQEENQLLQEKKENEQKSDKKDR